VQRRVERPDVMQGAREGKRFDARAFEVWPGCGRRIHAQRPGTRDRVGVGVDCRDPVSRGTKGVRHFAATATDLEHAVAWRAVRANELDGLARRDVDRLSHHHSLNACAPARR
jgi:hypothetical protein